MKAAMDFHPITIASKDKRQYLKSNISQQIKKRNSASSNKGNKRVIKLIGHHCSGET
jgi:hypothetical protein